MKTKFKLLALFAMIASITSVYASTADISFFNGMAGNVVSVSFEPSAYSDGVSKVESEGAYSLQVSYNNPYDTSAILNDLLSWKAIDPTNENMGLPDNTPLNFAVFGNLTFVPAISPGDTITCENVALVQATTSWWGASYYPWVIAQDGNTFQTWSSQSSIDLDCEYQSGEVATVQVSRSGYVFHNQINLEVMQ